jgi:multiple sugar transport system ATP-binding protein
MLIGNGDALTLTLRGGQSLRLVPRAPSQATGAVEVGVRPEHATLTALDAPEAALQAKIRMVERLGNQTLVHLDTPCGLFTLQGPGDLAAKAGEAAGLALDPTRAHVFGADGVAI